MMTNKKFLKGFFSVELLVVLFIAAAFIISGYQLYSSVLASSTNGKSDIAAANLANDYVERFRYRASTPCVEKTVIDELMLEHDFLRSPSVTVKITCPINGVTSFLKNGVSSKVEATITYDNGRKSSSSKIVNNKISIKQMAARYDFVAVLGTDGRVYTWGANNYGQLGNGTTGTTNNASAPVSVISDTGALAGKHITKISVGQYHMLALDSDGNVYAWGYGLNGRLGNGSTNDSSVPVAVAKATAGSSIGDKKIIDIAASASTSAAIDVDGNIHTWGLGTSGQLGNGNVVSSNVPVQISVPGGAKSIFGGSNHFLVINNSSLVYGWGSKVNYALGDGIQTGNSPSPVQISGLTNITQIAAGINHNMALTNTGVLYAWGLGTSGQLGENLTTTRTAPTNISVTAGFTSSSLAGRTITSIETGNLASYATDSLGITHAWGSNQFGQLGIAPVGTTSTGRKAREVTSNGTPIQGQKITQVAAGTSNVIALADDGNIFSWGRNNSGQLGVGTLLDSVNVASVRNGVTISKLTTGFYHSIVLMSDNTLYGWGRSMNYALGNGSTSSRNFPVTVTGTAMAGKTLVDLTTGGYHSFVRDSDGVVYGWGSNTSGQLGNGTVANVSTPKVISLVTGATITKIVASELNSMALTSDGKVYAWGSNVYGQVGNNTTTTPVSTPYQVSGGSLSSRTVVDIALGRYSAYAIDSTGEVHAWGRGASYANGNSSTANQLVPVNISNINSNSSDEMLGKIIVDVVAGDSFAIARASTGETYGWGLNTSGQLGDGTTGNRARAKLRPTSIQFDKMSAGGAFVVALSNNGIIYTWGSNTQYQQSNGTTTNVTTQLPRASFTEKAPDQISTGYSSVLVLDRGKNLYGWGYNSYGDLGVANNITPQQVPRPLTRIQYDNVW